MVLPDATNLPNEVVIEILSYMSLRVNLQISRGVSDCIIKGAKGTDYYDDYFNLHTSKYDDDIRSPLTKNVDYIWIDEYKRLFIESYNEHCFDYMIVGKESILHLWRFKMPIFFIKNGIK